jgi:hypothetical protein
LYHRGMERWGVQNSTGAVFVPLFSEVRCIQARVSGQWDPHGRLGPTSRTHVSGWTDGWDSCVRSGRRMGPTCKVGLKKFKCITGGSHVTG